MASETQSSPATADVRDTLTGYASRTELVVLGVTLFALAIRLVGLGVRVAHQDEARVAYWAYRYMESGVYWYRPIVHGPFLAIVDSYVFGLIGASDFSMRLVVALVGGLLPLVALLFRDRLRDSVVVGVAVLLAVNPLLLYYSRFYRNDVLLAGFMLAAFAFFVRAYDTRRPLHLYLGTAAFALAFTTKENALVYPVCWAGAVVLLWDRRLLIDRAGENGLLTAVGRQIADAARGLLDWLPHLALAVVEFLAIVVFFYAPRGEAAAKSPTLGQTLADPTLLPALVGEATLGSWHEFVGQWGSGSEDAYIAMFRDLLPAYTEGAAVVLALAVVGFLYDRYSGDGPSDVVAFAFYWGLFSVLGYPVIVSNPFPWEAIHAVMPLVVPAGVGLALLVRLGVESATDGDAVSTTAAALVILVLAAQVGATAYGTSFGNPQGGDNDLVQYAQSSSEMKPLLHEMRRVIRANDGIDVMYYGDDPSFDGDELYAPDESSHLTPTAGGGWFERLPFAWYLEMYGATTDSTDRAELIANTDDNPPIIIAMGESSTCSKSYDSAADIDQHLSGYERHEVNRFLYDSGCTVSSVAVYIEEGAPRA